jgi:hypothetical protein
MVSHDPRLPTPSRLELTRLPYGVCRDRSARVRASGSTTRRVQDPATQASGPLELDQRNSPHREPFSAVDRLLHLWSRLVDFFRPRAYGCARHRSPSVLCKRCSRSSKTAGCRSSAIPSDVDDQSFRSIDRHCLAQVDVDIFHACRAPFANPSRTRPNIGPFGGPNETSRANVVGAGWRLIQPVAAADAAHDEQARPGSDDRHSADHRSSVCNSPLLQRLKPPSGHAAPATAA